MVASCEARRRRPPTSTRLPTTPFRSDAAVPNGTSIAFLAEYGGAAALFAADAHAPVLVASIKRLLRDRGLDRLAVDVFKVSHHGSQNNVSAELLALLDCRRYLLSSNGDYFCHPDREAVGRIVKFGVRTPSLHFNYKSRYNDVWARARSPGAIRVRRALSRGGRAPVFRCR